MSNPRGSKTLASVYRSSWTVEGSLGFEHPVTGVLRCSKRWFGTQRYKTKFRPADGVPDDLHLQKVVLFHPYGGECFRENFLDLTKEQFDRLSQADADTLLDQAQERMDGRTPDCLLGFGYTVPGHLHICVQLPVFVDAPKAEKPNRFLGAIYTLGHATKNHNGVIHGPIT